MKIHTSIGPVHRAMMNSNDEEKSLAELKNALSEGGDINEIDREGRTPLFYATKLGFLRVIYELISNGASLNVQDRHLETALHFAARESKVDAAKILINNGANVDAKDMYGNTPLWRAVYSVDNCGDMIIFLLSQGADKTKKNKNGVSPEILAERIASHDAKRFLKN